jgi:hypothetical protein
LWLWLSSWAGRSKEHELISSILLKSRKRNLTIAFTTQSFHQVNLRIRDVTDFIAYPLMSVDNSYTRLEIFRGPRASMGTRINPPIYFTNEKVYALFNTYEEVKPISKEDSELQEQFFPIEENYAFIRYLQEQKRIKNLEKIKEICRKMQKEVNPEGITSYANL